MATINKKLESLSLDQIKRISKEYLLGWHDTMKYGFRVKGLNKKRREFGLEELTKSWSDEYRLSYIRSNYSYDIIESEIYKYLSTHLMNENRWVGIELFNCRFGREYARLFKALLGSSKYRKLSEKARLKKIEETQLKLYGGIGLNSEQTYDKYNKTLYSKYGVNNPMHILSVSENYLSPFLDKKTREKAIKTKLINSENQLNFYKSTGIIPDTMFKFSPLEKIVFVELVDRFGKNNVYYQYGVHPFDSRYPYSCDFYIKPLDLFIEINAHWSHGAHWFNSENHDDNLRVKHLSQFDKKSYKNAIRTWTIDDVSKRMKAKNNNLNYLVFWENDLSDFYKWFDFYDCNYKSFISDFPENSY